jgi:sec-independent protein translocase protein TatB
MFDIGWGELVLIGIVALIAIGPKELPTVLRSLGQWMGKIKRMANEFQGQFQEALREAEMSDLKKEAEELTSSLSDATKWDPLADIDNDGESASAEAHGESAPETSEAAQSEHTAVEGAPAHDGEAAIEPAAAAEPAELASAEGEENLPPIDVPPPEMPEPVTEKDFVPVDEPPPKQAGGKA